MATRDDEVYAAEYERARNMDTVESWLDGLAGNLAKTIFPGTSRDDEIREDAREQGYRDRERFGPLDDD